MKKLIYLLVITFLTINANAQLPGSRWKATLQLDQPVDVVFNFATDTLEVINATDNSSLETMKYTLKDTVLTIQKLFGQSSCDADASATYSFKISGDEMWLNLMSDDCDDRSGVLNNLKLTKTQ